MSTVIKSGDNGNTANVDDRNRLQTLATTESISTDSALQGEAFFLTSGIVELTSGDQSHIFYMKNTDIVDWVLRDFNTVINQSIGAPDLEIETQFTINPVSGTLITAGAVVIPANLNLGSSKSLEGVFTKGVEASTVTGGIAVPKNMYLPNRNNPAASANPIIVAPGTGFAFAIEPAVGNTLLKVIFNATIYRRVTS
jgi:hypothetical protein